MKHSSECVNLTIDLLAALGTALGLKIPQSIQDIITRMPAQPPPKTTTTTLAAAMTATSNVLSLTARIPVGAGDVIQVGTEKMVVQQVILPDPGSNLPTRLSVQRGAIGTTAAAQSSGAPVVFPAVPAADRVKNLIQQVLYQRANLSTPYTWAFQPTPPSWEQKPNQIGGAMAIAQTADLPGVVMPPASSSGLPDPAPPSSGPAQPQMEASHD